MKKIEAKIVNPLIADFIPSYATNGAAGIDLRACLEKPLEVGAGETHLIGSGIAIDINDTDAFKRTSSGVYVDTNIHGITLEDKIFPGDLDSLRSELQSMLFPNQQALF